MAELRWSVCMCTYFWCEWPGYSFNLYSNARKRQKIVKKRRQQRDKIWMQGSHFTANVILILILMSHWSVIFTARTLKCSGYTCHWQSFQSWDRGFIGQCWKSRQEAIEYTTFTFLNDNDAFVIFLWWFFTCVQESKRTRSFHSIWSTSYTHEFNQYSTQLPRLPFPRIWQLEHYVWVTHETQRAGSHFILGPPSTPLALSMCHLCEIRGSDFAIWVLTYGTLRYPLVIFAKSGGWISLLKAPCLILGYFLGHLGKVRFRHHGSYLRPPSICISHVSDVGKGRIVPRWS